MPGCADNLSLVCSAADIQSGCLNFEFNVAAPLCKGCHSKVYTRRLYLNGKDFYEDGISMSLDHIAYWNGESDRTQCRYVVVEIGMIKMSIVSWRLWNAHRYVKSNIQQRITAGLHVSLMCRRVEKMFSIHGFYSWCCSKISSCSFWQHVSKQLFACICAMMATMLSSVASTS